MPKIPNIILAILSALLLSAGWLQPFTLLILVAWVPLLIIEDRFSDVDHLKRKKLKLIALVYFTFLLWNLLVTWWVSYASFGGAIFAFVGNTTFMCVAFMLWHNLKQRINKPWAVWLLIPIWLGYEHGHTLWDLTWSWLIMGNAFAYATNLIQWYEFTGTSGGSLWVLVVSILVFSIIKKETYNIKAFIKPLIAVVLPISISLLILTIRTSSNNKQQTLNSKLETVIVQPNIDPYNDKFNTEPVIQLQNLLHQIKGKLTETTDFLVLPETYLTENINEGHEEQSLSLQILKDSILNKFPKLTIVTGASTYYEFKPTETPSSTARKFSNAELFFDYYNTGLQLNNQDGLTYYHKSKLVPGVERMPFPALLKPLESFAIGLGGTMGSLGTQEDRTVFFSRNKQIGIAPVICYESVYADYVSQYVKNGANLIFIITNDGWWENSPGHRQHLAYAKLRAIENRREIARCANTGISCFINTLGEIEQATPYWEPAIITKEIMPHNELTFFSQFGDLISYIASIVAILLVVWSQVLRFKK